MEQTYTVRQLASLDSIFGAPYDFLKRAETANNILVGLLQTERKKPGSFDSLSFYVVTKNEVPVLCAMQTGKRGVRYPLLLSALPDVTERHAVQCLALFLERSNAHVSEIAGFADVVPNYIGHEAWTLAGQQRLYVLHQLSALPSPSAGKMREATERDCATAQSWYIAFMRDVRQPAETPQQAANYRDVITGMVSSKRLFLWETVDGEAVSMAGIIRETETVCVVGPVYSPEESRGRGYASQLVGVLCSLILDRKQVPCLFADTWNPTSNRMYVRIGFEPLGLWERWRRNDT